MHPSGTPSLLALLAMLVLPFAGCLDETGPSDGEGDVGPAIPATLAFSDGVQAIACPGTCYEPNIAADPHGRLFVVDGSTGPIGVSEDGGRTWVQRDPPPMPQGLAGYQSDVLVQVAPDGRLFWSALVVVQPAGLFGIQVAWSEDGARTWAGDVHLAPSTGVAQVLSPDRQWLGFAPDGTLYLTYNQIPTGIWLARSDDGGTSWGGWTRVVPAEARPGGVGQSGPPVVDSAGRVFVPACGGSTQPGSLVFRSDDRGATFTSTFIDAQCSWFPILQVSPDDVLVLALQPGDATVLHSHDNGTSFVAPSVWGGAPVTAATWPVPVGHGVLHLAWYEEDGDASAVLVGTGTLDGGVTQRATVGRTVGPFGATARTTAATDFASMAVLPDGRLAIVWATDDAAAVAVQLPG